MRIEGQKHRLDVHDADPSGSAFDDVNLSGSRFHNINLSGGEYSQINLSGCSFEDFEHVRLARPRR